MKFKKIVMKNFWQYVDSGIEFALPNGGRDIMTFVAMNGAGKTTLVKVSHKKNKKNMYGQR